MYEDKKIEKWNNEYIAQFIDTALSSFSIRLYK